MTKSKKKGVSFMGGSLVPSQYDPKLLLAAYSIITGWSNIEYEQLVLFVFILGGKDDVATAVYRSLRTRGPKSAAIRAAAKMALHEDFYDVFIALEKASRKLVKHRDRLAHWTLVAQHERLNVLSFIDPYKFDGEFPRDVDEFTEDQLVNIEIRLNSLLNCYHGFNDYLSSDDKRREVLNPLLKRTFAQIKVKFPDFFPHKTLISQTAQEEQL